LEDDLWQPSGGPAMVRMLPSPIGAPGTGVRRPYFGSG
jgi:hypothetical protein